MSLSKIKKNKDAELKAIAERRQKLQAVFKCLYEGDYAHWAYRRMLATLPASGPIREEYCWSHDSEGTGWTCSC